MAEVTFTDRYVGTLLDTIEHLELTVGTVINFFSDHDKELNHHTGFGKREEELHPFTTRQNLAIRHPDST